MMRIKEAIQRRKLIQKMNDEWYAWEEENGDASTPTMPVPEVNHSLLSIESKAPLLQFAQHLSSRMTDLQRRALRITWKRLSEAPRTSGRGTIHLMEKVFNKMAETSDVMSIFYKSAFLSCVEDKKRTKQMLRNQLSVATPQTIKTVRDHAHLLVDFIDDIIALMFDNIAEKKSLDLEHTAQVHLRLEPLGFQKTLWIVFGESLAEVMFNQECVRAYPHAPSAWSLLSVAISDQLHAVARKSRTLPSSQTSSVAPTTLDKTKELKHEKSPTSLIKETVPVNQQLLHRNANRQRFLDFDDRYGDQVQNFWSPFIDPLLVSSLKQHSISATIPQLQTQSSSLLSGGVLESNYPTTSRPTNAHAYHQENAETARTTSANCSLKKTLIQVTRL